jgi:2-oxoglutarate dehydrogenase E2 component (dihydrolipoamide succinyltransferase)
MANINIVVPELSESVVEATVAEWLVKVGDAVNSGDVLVVLETDKVNLEVTAEQAGTITEITAQEDEDVNAGAVLAVMDTSGEAPAPQAPQPAQQPQAETTPAPASSSTEQKATPVAQRVASANNVDVSRVSPSDGEKVSKADVEKFIANQSKPAAPVAQPSQSSPFASLVDPSIGRREELVKLSRRRRTIATRLVEAQSTAAMLTTFNEVDMKPVMDIRKKHKEAFREKYGVGLGFTSFFVKAVVGGLKAFPNLNAEISDDGKEVILKHYYDIGIAIGAEEGLVVPVIRDCDRLSFAGIEGNVKKYAVAASDGSLSLDALRGGTFTITNGGVFGSMMSTPILNPPQVGILGLHGIKERAIVIDGEIVIRPMMYLALTYDHRIVDGRESVQFLVKVKELIEDPERLLIEG